jgi:hypothetical protein
VYCHEECRYAECNYAECPYAECCGALSIGLIGAFRGQHCKGKQNKILMKINLKERAMVSNFYIYKIERAFTYWIK